MGDYFWLVAYQYTPHLSATVTGNAAINERPEKLLARTLEHLVECDRGGDFTLTFAHEISREMYERLKPHNPRRGYLQLLDSDRGGRSGDEVDSRDAC